MLLTARKWRVSFSGSLILLGLSTGLLYVSVRWLAERPLTVRGILGGLGGSALFLFVLGRFRFASLDARGRIFVRTLFGNDGVESRACAFGIEAETSWRARTIYTVYATDGTARADFAECISKRGARLAARRLEDCFGVDSSEPARASAKARVDAVRQRFEAT